MTDNELIEEIDDSINTIIKGYEDELRDFNPSFLVFFYLCKTYNFVEASKKANIWMDTTNTLLGDLSPNDYIKLGRIKKLKDFIISSIKDNSL